MLIFKLFNSEIKVGWHDRSHYGKDILKAEVISEDGEVFNNIGEFISFSV